MKEGNKNMVNIFTKLEKNMDYNTFNKVKSGLYIVAINLKTASIFLLPANTPINSTFSIVGNLLLLGSFILAIEDGKETADICKIKELYQEFIKNYSKINKIFNLQNPIEIYKLYSYLLYGGYLSVNHKFFDDDRNARDILGILGADVLNGYGVCHNNAAVLTDILKQEGIIANEIGVYYKSNSIKIDVLEESKYTKDELKEWVQKNIISGRDYDYLLSVIDVLLDKEHVNIEISKEVKNSFSISKIIGNHAITYATKDGKNYFLDPTKQLIYYQTNNNKFICSNEDYSCKFKPLLTYITFGRFSNYWKMLKLISTNNTCNLEEERQSVVYVDKILEKNKDIFENFYNDNSEIYQEVSARLNNIKNLSLKLKQK